MKNHTLMFHKQSFLFLALVITGWMGTAVALDDAPQPQEEEPREEDLRVMSFNIRYGTARDGDNHWNKRKEFVAETIKKYDPDLLGTQEALDFQKEFLQKQLPGYTSIGVGRDDGAAKGEMTAIFFRTDRFEKLGEGHFWLSETPQRPGSKSWDSSLPRICSWVKLRDRKSSEKPILFMNTHFAHRGRQARVESAKLLRVQAQKLGADCDIIITGDFNAPVGSEPYSSLFDGEDFVDTYKAAGTVSTLGEATFSGFRAGKVAGGRIDWVAASTAWKVVRADIDRTARDGRTPSDHYPVTATLRRKPSAQ